MTGCVHDHSRWGPLDQFGATNLLTVKTAWPRCARSSKGVSTISATRSR
jgi:hypothetical protein